jgi:acyl-CoA thioesterase-1
MKYYRFYLVLILSLILVACRGEAPKGPPASPEAIPPAAPAAPVQPKKSVPKIIAFGDSLTAGYGLPLEQSYPSLLQNRLDREGLAYEVVNAAACRESTGRSKATCE